jgi:large subunit ribosomal protein L22
VTAARPEVQAVAKFVHVSPRKARLVADHIRGRSVPEARTVLAFTPRAAAHEIEKVLKSAVANAYIKHQWDGDDLYVKAVFVDEGPTLKRWRARARGRVNRILKRTCHITIKLDRLEAPTGPGKSDEGKRSRRRRRGGEATGASPAKPSRRKKEAVV